VTLETIDQKTIFHQTRCVREIALSDACREG